MSMKNAKCLFWTISIGNNTAFLIGSMHLMRKDMHPLPDKFENAFSASSIIVFEASMEEAATPEFRQYIQSVGYYPPGETIWEHISQKTQKKLLKRLSEIEIPVSTAEKIRPWLLSTMMNKASDKEKDNPPQHALGIDAYYFNKAKQEGKALMFLEDAKDQADATAKMPPREQEFLLKDSMRKDAAKGEISLYETIDLWKNGKADELEFHYRKHHKKHMKIYQHVIINRNRRWLKKIEQMFQLGENLLIIVGAGHAGGPDGLVRLLTDKGYKVVQK